MYLTSKFIYREFQATGENWDGSILHMQMDFKLWLQHEDQAHGSRLHKHLMMHWCLHSIQTWLGNRAGNTVIANKIRKEKRNVCDAWSDNNHGPLLYIPIGFQHSEARSMQKWKKV